jgi:hypothetical protein
MHQQRIDAFLQKFHDMVLGELERIFESVLEHPGPDPFNIALSSGSHSERRWSWGRADRLGSQTSSLCR